MARDQWAEFADADDWSEFDDAPAPSPSFSPTPAPKSQQALSNSAAPIALQSPQAIDGDTIKTPATGSLRLWGADAPEVNQRGWKRDMSTVPLGRMSRDALSRSFGDDVKFGPSVMQSYGRQVGPLTSGDVDLATKLLRSGNAFAAPEYIDEPERRFDYLEAERLARQNRLGVHGVVTPSPADFRADPNYVPERETVAMFFDTPTPLQGLSAEDEQRWLNILKVGTANEIAAFAKSVGMGLDEERNRKWVSWRDEEARKGKDVDALVSDAVRYERGATPVVDLGDGSLGAGARQFSEGFLAGGLGEAGALVDSFGGTEDRENVWNSDRRFADIFANNLYQNDSILGHDEMTYPNLSTGANLAGAVTSGFVIPYGAGARTIPQLARVGGFYGGAEGFLGTRGRIGERLKGSAIGAPVGAGVNAVGGKALEYAAPFFARGYQSALGRLGRKAEQEATGAQAGRPAPDEWSEFDDAPEGALERTIGMDAEPMPSLPTDIRQPDYLDMGLPRPGRLADPLTKAQREALAGNVRPEDVLPMPGAMVDGVEDAAGAQAGRFAEALVPNERGLLDRGTVRNWRGEDVPKVGPTDMVGWLRLNGGLRDQSGDLSAMGLGNSARRGMDFVGQEARFGPLVSDEGMNLDDAALAAWEAGYFPELSERPSINQFLDALRETHDGGSGRRFLPDDAPTIEAYYGQQGERYALEQQRFEVGGPIYQDRSGAGDDAAPFPPVEAYEDWPADGPDFAGNIRLDKLDSPQDISRALTQAQRNVGFDAATRGRITQEETARLASDLNMTSEQLLSRRNGQAFNAEEALAARQLLAKSGNELVNAARRITRLDEPGDEVLAEFRQKWMRHVAIQEQVAGMTAEAGRVLQQFRMAADSRQVRGDVLAGLVRAGGGKDDLQDAAEALIEASEVSPGVFNSLADQARKPAFRNKFSELYINALLSNPPTHIVNMVSNTLTSMLQVPEYATGAAIGAARKALAGSAGKERILASEVGARTFGLVQGVKEGARLFARALRTGDADDFVSKVEGDEFKAISGIKGEVVRIPTRFLTAEDQFFKGIARRMELGAQAVRIAHKEGLQGAAREARIAELIANPTDEMMERALDYGRYLTFQRKLGPAGQAVSTFTSNNLLGKIVVPFVRTPINLMKFATERSPAAPLLKEWRADMRAGGERRDMAIARMMLGTGFATMMYQAALDGTITGGVPSDPAKARAMYADGWQPYSVKVGDRYISYSRLDPLSTTIGVAADMATLPDGLSDRQKDDKATMLVASIMGNLASKTWLSGMSSFVEGLSDPGRYAGNWLERTASSMAVPAGVAGVARSIDPVSRKRESVGEAIQARIPGMTDDLLPRRDVFGEIIENDSLGPDLISPFWQSEAKNDPVIAEMMRIGKSLSAPGKQYTEGGERIDYTPEEYDRYHEIAGRLSYNALADLTSSLSYQTMNDAQRRKAAKKAITAARKGAREELGNPGYQLPSKRAVGAPSEQASEWDQFEDAEPAGDEWSEFDDAPQRDVIGSLQSAIPGVGITSGYRTPEYQADMRRRGYRPAANSAHLDGSALDLKPPPGRSLSWLMARVRQVEPEADLLPEGDHLHVTFPGWFAAPALGGAREAGVRNPALAR